MTMLRDARRGLKTALHFLLPILIITIFTGCGSTSAHRDANEHPETTRSISHAGFQALKVSNGDKLRVTTFNEEQLSGEFVVDETGSIAFPLIGQTRVGGLTTQEIEQRLKDRLSGRFLVNPRITVEVANQRPFYILGEVAKPGEYPYRPGLNVVGAIATAGGFSPRASTGQVIVRRGDGAGQKEYPVEPDVAIYPGDMITVEERLF